ncbi:CoA transferase (plasmid) [Acinetobacter sp. LoGeW2-3]|uniref:CaiB/BaiF CoA transferase family protein n=1 Tax=Acinetobacter sp. LoGeW2-3 TaxID=1808001 RepID=UPI000C05A9A6|nr:CaiB/BaiF CoA-transferase family protein [Acinetobacter sp. LoGeW2-3]ATO21159.1 CoA transferase [Acinetobacter sp. LoGeW2-3]
MPALDGITVISLEHAIAAPFCTRQLADLGARVIKIERPRVGDFARNYDDRVHGMSSHFVWANRSKESLSLDLKTQDGQDILKKLLLKADVLVQNLAPGAASRLGYSYEELVKINPGIIVCDISGYGDDQTYPGPYRDKKAYDLLIQSEAGFLSVTGTEQEPVKAGCSIVDISAGMYAYSNILAALIERDKTGKGKRIDISMLECMTEWMGHPLYYTLNGGAAPARTGSTHATIYPYGPFATGDQKQVVLGVQNEREWQAFCTIVLDKPQLSEDPLFQNNALRSKNRQLLRHIIEQTFSQWDQKEILSRLEHAKIANASVNEIQEVWQHPQLEARQRWMEVDSPIGIVPALKPVGLSDENDFVMKPIPDLGQHSLKILVELGYDPDAIQVLSAQGII